MKKSGNHGEEEEGMVFVEEGGVLPEGTLFVVMVSGAEGRFLDGVPERKRFNWLKRLRRRRGLSVEILFPEEFGGGGKEAGC
jgi:hypothetical protein